MWVVERQICYRDLWPSSYQNKPIKNAKINISDRKNFSEDVKSDKNGNFSFKIINEFETIKISTKSKRLTFNKLSIT